MLVVCNALETAYTTITGGVDESQGDEADDHVMRWGEVRDTKTAYETEYNL